MESFFNVGGNSLHIPQIVGSINNEFKTCLTIRGFILNSTIRELSAFRLNNGLLAA
ncbi:phosphopantetheine-binding protein [Candidatus Paracaedibacter symbiosus]|uniref:phosphopantetheine-binding protein n=1 Tax=Candidatus Paracaedibacter symbiosus TaxID=244582 RepID=UPI0012EB5019